jgi:hypothetical protein
VRVLSWFQAAALAVLALLARVPLLLAFPAIHGGDSIARLAHSDRFVLAYQLPLPQAVVFLVRGLAPDPFWTRLAFVVLGSLLAPALAEVVGRVSLRPAGIAAGVLMALHPMFAYYSLVPYQESLMTLFLLLAADALLRGREVAAGLSMGLACLCRYEAWIGAALAAAGRAFGPAARRGARPLVGASFRAAVLFGWAPVLWILGWHGLAPSGTYVLDLDPTAGRAARLGFVLGKVREYSGNALVVLAVLGAGVVLWRRERRGAWAAGFVGLMLLVTVAAGHEFPPGSGRVSERLAHVPAAFLCALAGVAIGALMGEASRPVPTALSGRLAAFGRPLVAALLLSVIAVRWTHRTHDLVAEANRDPSLCLARSVAVFAGSRLAAGTHLAVVAPPVDPAALDAYVDKVGRAGGNVARAREVALALAHSSPDADRIAAHLPRRPGTVVGAGEASASLLAVYDDAPDAGRWRSGEPLARFEAAPRAVTIYRGYAAAGALTPEPALSVLGRKGTR